MVIDTIGLFQYNPLEMLGSSPLYTVGGSFVIWFRRVKNAKKCEKSKGMDRTYSDVHYPFYDGAWFICHIYDEE
jgi:hypothetical protein